jgi:folate-binding protein YgfZ
MAVAATPDALLLITDSGEAAPRLAASLQSMRFRADVLVADVSKELAVIGTTADPARVADADGDGGGATRRTTAESEAAGSAVSGMTSKTAALGFTLVATWADPWPDVSPGGTSYGPVQGHPGDAFSWNLLVIERAALQQAFDAAVASGFILAGTWASEALRVAAWRPRFASEVDHRSFPHELDWLRTAVGLKKGCYRGQEVVARIHNVGHPPRRLVALHLDGSDNALPNPGDRVVLADHLGRHSTDEDAPDAITEFGKDVGHITSAVHHYDLGPIALALVKRTVPADALLTVVVHDENLGEGEGEGEDAPEILGHDGMDSEAGGVGKMTSAAIDLGAPRPHAVRASAFADDLRVGDTIIDAKTGHGIAVAASQEVIVPVSGESATRPAKRGPLMPGLRAPGGAAVMLAGGAPSAAKSQRTSSGGSGITLNRHGRP